MIAKARMQVLKKEIERVKAELSEINRLLREYEIPHEPKPGLPVSLNTVSQDRQ